MLIFGLGSLVLGIVGTIGTYKWRQAKTYASKEAFDDFKKNMEVFAKSVDRNIEGINDSIFQLSKAIARIEGYIKGRRNNDSFNKKSI